MNEKSETVPVRNPNGFPAIKFTTSDDAEQIKSRHKIDHIRQSRKQAECDQMLWSEVQMGWYVSRYNGKEYMLEFTHFHNPSKNCWFFDGNQWIAINRNAAAVLHFTIAQQLQRLEPNYRILSFNIVPPKTCD